MLPRKALAILLAAAIGNLPPAAADSLTQAILACRDVPDEQDRVRCYDVAVDRYASSGITTDESAAPASDSAPAVSAEELFGMSPIEAQRSLEEAAGNEPIDRISAMITEVRSIAPKRVAVWLDNGQVWKQTGSSALHLSSGDEVVIRRRSLGSHTLQKTGGATAMRVTRVD